MYNRGATGIYNRCREARRRFHRCEVRGGAGTAMIRRTITIGQNADDIPELHVRFAQQSGAFYFQRWFGCGGYSLPPLAPPRRLRGLKVEETGVCKVVRERAYSLAWHPSKTKLLLAVGDKVGWLVVFLRARTSAVSDGAALSSLAWLSWQSTLAVVLYSVLTMLCSVGTAEKKPAYDQKHSKLLFFPWFLGRRNICCTK